MKPQELFRVFHKSLGLWSLLYGVSLLPRAASMTHQYADADGFYFMAMGSFASPAVLIGLGYWLLFSRDSVVRLAYPNQDVGELKLPCAETLEVVLKTIGVFELIIAASYVPVAIDTAHRYPERVPLVSMLMNAYATPILLAIAGIIFVLKTDWMVRLAFLNRPDPDMAKETAGLSLSQLFLVIQKSLGASTAVSGLSLLPSAFRMSQLYAAGFPTTRMLLETFANPAIFIAVGCWLFFSTKWFVHLAYSDHSRRRWRGFNIASRMIGCYDQSSKCRCPFLRHERCSDSP